MQLRCGWQQEHYGSLYLQKGASFKFIWNNSAKNFVNFLKTFWSVKAYSGLINIMPQPARSLTLLTDVALIFLTVYLEIRLN